MECNSIFYVDLFFQFIFIFALHAKLDESTKHSFGKQKLVQCI